jgi:excisionase family DNA binding protein
MGARQTTAPNTEGTYLTERELASLLRTSQRTLQGWRIKGQGPAFMKLGSTAVRYRRSDVERWMTTVNPVEQATR